MNLETKLELMERYQFDGFASRFGVIQTWINILTSNEYTQETRKETIGKIREAYTFMQDCYTRIDFQELDRNGARTDDDFKTLYLTAEILPRLKIAIDSLETYARAKNFQVSREDEPIKLVYGITIELAKADNYKGIRYRTRIGIIKKRIKGSSKPAPFK